MPKILHPPAPSNKGTWLAGRGTNLKKKKRKEKRKGKREGRKRKRGKRREEFYCYFWPKLEILATSGHTLGSSACPDVARIA